MRYWSRGIGGDEMPWNRETEEPGGRIPAPGELAIVQAFLNSVDLEDRIERFDTPAHLAQWLIDRGLLAPTATLGDEDVERVTAVREALRDLLTPHSGGPIAADARGRLHRGLGAAELTVQFAEDGRPDLAPVAAGVDGALARIMAIVYRASVDGAWQRLKTCRNDVCRWAFYDASKNRSSAWCTMAICGSQRKARAYRQRKPRKAKLPSDRQSFDRK